MFITAEAEEDLFDVKIRLAKAVNKQPEDVQVLKYESIKYRRECKEEEMKELRKEELDEEGNVIPPPAIDPAYLKEAYPPLDEGRAIQDLGIKNDSIVLFVYRTSGSHFEEADVDFFWDQDERALNQEKRDDHQAILDKLAAAEN